MWASLKAPCARGCGDKAWRGARAGGVSTPKRTPRDRKPFRRAGESLHLFDRRGHGVLLNVRRFLKAGGGHPPTPSGSRSVNYFDYAYAPRPTASPSPSTELAEAPGSRSTGCCASASRGGRSRRGSGRRATSSFIDVSGRWRSQQAPAREGGPGALVDRMTESDRVAIVVYAGKRVWLPDRGPQGADPEAIGELRPGSTAGASGSGWLTDGRGELHPRGSTASSSPPTATSTSASPATGS